MYITIEIEIRDHEYHHQAKRFSKREVKINVPDDMTVDIPTYTAKVTSGAIDEYKAAPVPASQEESDD